MIDRIKILDLKEQWLESGFIGNAIFCDFLLMKEDGKDIIYNSDDNLVMEYKELLEQRLESGNDNLLLMANTEIERCTIDDEEEISAYLYDEIYAHFERNNNEYPLPAVGLHIDILDTLLYFDDPKSFFDYFYRLKDIYQAIFGEKSYLFCRNWCHVLAAVLRNGFLKTVVEEFEDNLNRFSNTLKEEEILYILCLNVAIERVKREQNYIYMEDAIELCKAWYKETPIEKQREICKVTYGISGRYYRNIGEYDKAINIYKKEIELTSDEKCKLFSIAQIGSMMYLKHSWEELGELFDEFAYLMGGGQDPDKNMAELYNILGLYYWKKGDFHEAQIQIEKAINIGKKIGGENADIAIKYKCNKVLIEYGMGEFDDAYLQIDKLAQIISSDLQRYSESRTVVFNNLVAMSFENSMGSSMTFRLKTILDRMHVKYDMASSIVFKCNFYWSSTVSGNDCFGSEMEKLQIDLQKYFDRYPYGEGYLQFLMGECYRTFRENDTLELYKTLEKTEGCLKVEVVNGTSPEYIIYFIVKLKNLLYKREYVIARKWLLSLWTEAMFPLFEMMIGKEEENTKHVRTSLYRYISLFVSSARQYPQLKITDKELYEYVLNYKCYEDAFLYRRSEFDLMVRRQKWLSINEIKLERNSAIVECFVYAKYDMEDINELFGTGGDVLSSMYYICFGIEIVSSLFQKYSVEVISDISCVTLGEKMDDMIEKDEVSQLERETWNRLKKIVGGKKILYICMDTSMVYIPLSAMRINENMCWCERYQIIYCNTGGNVREDVDIQDISNSVYFGMTCFDGDIESGTSKMEKRFMDLPYVEAEIEKLSELTGGATYIDEGVPETWFTGRQKEIIYISTHATECEDDGEKALLVGKDKDGRYICLKSSDIAKFAWKGVKLVVLSACETNKESARKTDGYTLSQAVKKAGALYSISTTIEVEEGIASFFMVCFHKNLMKYKKIAKSFFETQKLMYSMTKKEILADKDYVDIGMDIYLKNLEEDDIPFLIDDEWTFYVLQMN